jgi:hypothetical protein
MKKAIVAILLSFIGFISCTEKQQVLTKKDVQHKVDSLIQLKTEEINRQANEDLDYRTAIEVKAKADSIVAARNNPKAAVVATTMQPPQAIAEQRKRKFDSLIRARHGR